MVRLPICSRYQATLSGRRREQRDAGAGERDLRGRAEDERAVRVAVPRGRLEELASSRRSSVRWWTA